MPLDGHLHRKKDFLSFDPQSVEELSNKKMLRVSFCVKLNRYLLSLLKL